MTYNAQVHREQGGSVLNIGSGAFARVQSGGCQVLDAGGTLTVAAGASVTFNTTVSGTGIGFDIGGSRISMGAGANIPTHTAVPGSVYIRVNGSMSGWFVNIGQDIASSAWRAFQQGSAIG